MICLVGTFILYKRRVAANAREWGLRPPMSDADFLCACEVADEPFDRMVATAARQAIASLGTVPAETILPEQVILGDLSNLPFWDSIDWLSYMFEVEKQAKYEIKVPANVIRGAVLAAGGYAQVSVRDLIRATVASAVPATWHGDLGSLPYRKG